ncbi:MAG: SAM-dependent methyltransferase [Bacteroidetes bacterium]|nr:MAG: SAM-dependent methyltransferase [Bacteroidota bacterium]
MSHSEIVFTKDGSPTLFLPDYNEHYHSVHGALQESKHVYIENGLAQISQSSVKIFELGFGTGLNAALSFLFAEQNRKKIEYHTIEKFPLPAEIVENLQYEDSLNEYLKKIHSCSWEKLNSLSSYFKILKINADVNTYKPERQYFDLIYFDAFAPRVQPELWSEILLAKMYDMLKKNGFLVTYCANGEFKRNMKKCGFKVVSLPGPPGKREMTKGIKV